MQTRPFAGVLIGSALILISGACRKAAAPDLKTTTGVQPRSQVTSVSGCLRQGFVADKYVLMTSAATGLSQTTTFDLVPIGGVKLADYVGQQVEICGTIGSEQQIAATSGTIGEQPAKGTTATPKVSTETELDVKTMDVARVSPTGHRCD